jgi:hypothetical protein
MAPGLGDNARERPGVGAGSCATSEELDGWVSSLRELIPTPPEYREETIDRRTALEMLRCEERVIDELLDQGLYASGPRGEERFDRWDLFNVALYSRSRRSIPELSALVVARAAAERPEAWTERREVALTLGLGCTREGGCAASPSWLVRAPTPERFGGTISPWESSSPLRQAAGAGGALTASEPRSLELRARVVSCGSVRRVRSSFVRARYWEIVHGLRFQVLPHALAIDSDRIAEHGAVDCTAVAKLLGAQCAETGLEARVEKGLLLTMLGIDNHAWLEVRDEDGEWKTIDCSLAMISLGSPIPNPAFAEFCLGSQFNRVLPFHCQAAEPIISHECGDQRRSVDARVTISAGPGGASAAGHDGRVNTASEVDRGAVALDIEQQVSPDLAGAPR